jgi:glycosyltransferase involved in cell wall biosynthesis
LELVTIFQNPVKNRPTSTPCGGAESRPPLKLVILHDYLTQAGGAERVVASMLERWPQAELRTLVFDPSGTFPVFAHRDPQTSWLQPLASRMSHRVLLPALPLATRSLGVEEADIVISSSSGWAHGIPVAPGIPHICYCHNPPRWLYDTQTYLGNRHARRALSPVLSGLRRWDRAAGRRPTRYVANSENVRARIRSVYGRPATVVHPPVDVDRFAATALPSTGYLLVLSRLLPYKRVDLAIAAARSAGVPVVVAGEGPDRRRLQRLANGSIEFLGRVRDADLQRLFEGASAVFCGGEEDFGITPLEANAAARPVVAYGRGGALETVIDGETGVLFSSPDEEAAGLALRRALDRDWDADRLTEHAAEFGRGRFLDRLETVVEEELARI